MSLGIRFLLLRLFVTCRAGALAAADGLEERQENLKQRLPHSSHSEFQVQV